MSTMRLVEQPADAPEGSAGKFRKNATYRREWRGDTLILTRRDGHTRRWIMSHVSQPMRDILARKGAEEYGDEAAAVSELEFPDTKARSAESWRRRCAKLDVIFSGASNFPEASGVNEGMAIQALMRHASLDHEAAVAMIERTATKRLITFAGACGVWLATPEIRAAAAAIELERASAGVGAAENLSADDLLAEMKGAQE